MNVRRLLVFAADVGELDHRHQTRKVSPKRYNRGVATEEPKKERVLKRCYTDFESDALLTHARLCVLKDVDVVRVVGKAGQPLNV